MLIKKSWGRLQFTDFYYKQTINIAKIDLIRVHYNENNNIFIYAIIYAYMNDQA